MSPIKYSCLYKYKYKIQKLPVCLRGKIVNPSAAEVASSS